MDQTTIRIICGLLALFVWFPAVIVPYWKIFTKAGFPGWLAVLQLVPVVGLIVLYYVAFSKWKYEVAKPTV